MSGVVGLIAHSGAAQDVRRLTSLARTVDVHERVNVLARVLAGVGAVPGVEVVYMPEPTRLVPRALEALAAIGGAPRPPARPLDLPAAKSAAGTRSAAAALAGAGAACVVTYGGDGTNRAAAAGWPDAILLPLPGGTNNAFATPVDPTAAGLAAARLAVDPDRLADRAERVPRIDVSVPGRPDDMALVDVALVRDEWLGAHAVWDPSRLLAAVVTRADPTLPGLCGVAGTLARNGARSAPAVHVRFGAPGTRVLAPLGPGRLLPVEVREWGPLAPGQVVEMPGPGAIALDGEREIVLRPGEVARVRVAAAGPRVLGAAALLRDATLTPPPGEPAHPSPGGH